MDNKENIKKQLIIAILIAVIILGITSFVIFRNIREQVSGEDKEALIVPTVVHFDNVLGNEVEKGTEIKVAALFQYFGSKQYYYKPVAYADGTAITNYKCTLVDTNKGAIITFKVDKNDTYASWTIYKDSSCKNKVVEYKTLKYKIKDSTVGNSSTSNSSSSNNTTNNNNNNSNNSTTQVQKTFKATFDKNGATSIGSSSLSCNTTGSSCTVKAPSIKRDGYTIVGWNTSKNATTAQYKVGSTITLTKNTTFYAITTKNSVNTPDRNVSIKITQPSTKEYSTNQRISITVGHTGNKTYYYKFVTYNKGAVSYPEPNCISINKGQTRTFTLDVNANYSSRYAIIRLYSDNKCSNQIDSKQTNTYTYKKASSSSSGTSTTTTTQRSKMAVSQTVKGVKVYVESACSKSVVDKYISDLKNTPDYVIQTQKIYIVTRNTLKSWWPKYSNLNISGMTSGSGATYITDISCANYYDTTLPHELAHSMDAYYNYKTGKGYIANREDFVIMYSKYRGKIFSEYSFTNYREFFADSYAYYFKNKSGYPADLKLLMKETLSEMSKTL